MVFCQNYGNELKDGEKVCANYGTTVECQNEAVKSQGGTQLPPDLQQKFNSDGGRCLRYLNVTFRAIKNNNISSDEFKNNIDILIENYWPK